jgi:hypothetical protein
MGIQHTRRAPVTSTTMPSPLVDEEQKPMNYTQCFKLQPDGAGSYFVLNDVFRLTTDI